LSSAARSHHSSGYATGGVAGGATFAIVKLGRAGKPGRRRGWHHDASTNPFRRECDVPSRVAVAAFTRRRLDTRAQGGLIPPQAPPASPITPHVLIPGVRAMPEATFNNHRNATRTQRPASTAVRPDAPRPLRSYFSSPSSRSLSRCNRDRFLECLRSDTTKKLYSPNEPIRKPYFNPGCPAHALRVCQTRPRG
jgi:hypothetical protein